MRTLSLLALLATTLGAQLPLPHPLFDGDAVHEIRLYFDSPNWYQQLRENFEGKDDPDYAEATFVWNDIRMERAGVRFKGNSSYRSYPGTKKSFKIKTNEFVKGRRIQGIDTLNLHNAFKDAAFVREKIYYELARDSGLKAPRTNYAALFINDEFWGLYFLTEDIDGEFLENHIGAKEDGNLYKGDPRGTLEWRGPDPAPYKREYEKDNNEDEDDWSDLIALIDVLNRTPPPELAGRLEPLVDIDSALSLIALDILTVNLDSYIGSGHNYYLYRRKADGKFLFFPWDPNEAFGSFDMGLSLEERKNLPLFWLPRLAPPPGLPPPPANAVMPRPLAQRLWQVPEYRQRYLDKLKALAEGPAQPDAVISRMHVLRALIRPWIERETRNMFTLEQWERAMTEDVRTGGPAPGGPGGPGQPPGAPMPLPGMLIPGLEPFVQARAASAAAQTQILHNYYPPPLQTRR